MNTYLDIEEIYESCDVDRDIIDTNLQELVDAGYLVKGIHDEDVIFSGMKELSWSHAVQIDCEVKKEILLCFIENPKSFFVLYNTQKGKSAIVAKEMRDWKSSTERVVGFLMVDNDLGLADQSSDGLKHIVKDVADVFMLSSKSDDKIQSIKDRIDSYACIIDDKQRMPIIVALNNPKQVEKIIELMNHVKDRMKMGGQMSNLRYGVVFDEADKIYPPVREKFKDLLINDDSALHRLGFVTATEGDLMDAEYEECFNAYMHPVPAGDPNYRAIHLEEAIIKIVPHRVKEKNDSYAETILKDNDDYFKKQIKLKDGSLGYRKVIVNGGSKCSSMENFAKNRISEGYHAITVNMNGVIVYRAGQEKKKYSTKGIRFSQLLFNIYKELGLHDKPLIIIGRKKVDRGLGFHHAPPDGSEGLIWSDMILGRVEDKTQGPQKSGRLAGKVAQSPQYPGSLTWWTDQKTASMVCRHNDVVDVVNTKKGCSALQAIKHGEAETPVRKPEETPNDILISEVSFSTVKEAKEWGITHLDQSPAQWTPCDSEGKHGGSTHYHYRGELREITSEKSTRESKDLGGGQGTYNEKKKEKSKTGSPRVFPVLVDDVVKYIVVYKRFNIKA
jgi:hypothetical protein